MASKARSPPARSAGSQVIVRNEGEGAGGRRGYCSYSPAPYDATGTRAGGRDRQLPRRSGLGRVSGRADDTPVPLVYYSAWRLRWCALLLLIGTATQAISVGGANADSCRASARAGCGSRSACSRRWCSRSGRCCRSCCCGATRRCSACRRTSRSPSSPASTRGFGRAHSCSGARASVVSANHDFNSLLSAPTTARPSSRRRAPTRAASSGATRRGGGGARSPPPSRAPPPPGRSRAA